MLFERELRHRDLVECFSMGLTKYRTRCGEWVRIASMDMVQVGEDSPLICGMKIDPHTQVMRGEMLFWFEGGCARVDGEPDPMDLIREGDGSAYE